VSRDWLHEGTLLTQPQPFCDKHKPALSDNVLHTLDKISPRLHRTLLQVIKDRSVTATPSHLVTSRWAGLRISSTSNCRLRSSSLIQFFCSWGFHDVVVPLLARFTNVHRPSRLRARYPIGAPSQHLPSTGARQPPHLYTFFHLLLPSLTARSRLLGKLGVPP